MILMKIFVKTICNDRLFSAEGANILFNHLICELNKLEYSDNAEIEIDFEGVPLVSTSFIGRFHERMSFTKINFKIAKFWLRNLKPEIKRQFLKKDL